VELTILQEMATPACLYRDQPAVTVCHWKMITLNFPFLAH